MKVKIIIVTLFLMGSMLFGQNNYRDVVIKKDGSELRGIIIENKINDFIRIELTGGSIFKIPYGEIDTMKKEQDVAGATNNNSVVINNTNTNTNESTANASSSGLKSAYTGYLSSELVGLLKGKSVQKLDKVKIDDLKLRDTDISEKMAAYSLLESDKAIPAAALNFFVPIKGIGSFYQGDINQGVTTLVVNVLLGLAVSVSYVAFLGSSISASSYNDDYHYDPSGQIISFGFLISSAAALSIYNIVQVALPFSYEKKYNKALKTKLKY